MEHPLVYAQEWYFWVLRYFESRLHLLICTFVVGHAHIIWLLLLCRSVYGMCNIMSIVIVMSTKTLMCCWYNIWTHTVMYYIWLCINTLTYHKHTNAYRMIYLSARFSFFLSVFSFTLSLSLFVFLFVFLFSRKIIISLICQKAFALLLELINFQNNMRINIPILTIKPQHTSPFVNSPRMWYI